MYVLHKLKQSGYVFTQNFLCFSEQANSSASDKVKKLYNFLQSEVLMKLRAILSREGNDGSKKIHKILILNDYKSFIATLQISSIFHDFKTILRANKHILLVFIGRSITKKQT